MVRFRIADTPAETAVDAGLCDATVETGILFLADKGATVGFSVRKRGTPHQQENQEEREAGHRREPEE